MIVFRDQVFTTGNVVEIITCDGQRLQGMISDIYDWDTVQVVRIGSDEVCEREIIVIKHIC